MREHLAPLEWGIRCIPVGKASLTKAPTQAEPGRVCVSCPTVLSVYNPDNECAACERGRRGVEC
jgi:hypothetical protein